MQAVSEQAAKDNDNLSKAPNCSQIEGKKDRVILAQNELEWASPDDPERPMNWSIWRKLGIAGAVCAMRFTTPFASSMMAPALLRIGKDMHSPSDMLLSFSVSIYIIGYGAGPLVLAPLSEVYGRNIIYHIGNTFFLIFSACCGLSSNLPSLLAFRFLAGVFGGVPLTISGGTIVDIVPVERRGLIMSIFTLSMLIGPVLGPMIGGFITEAIGWRWIFWILTILSGCTTIIGFIFLRETHSPVLLERKASLLRRELDNPVIQVKNRSNSALGPLLAHAILRPMQLLFNPIVLITSLYMAIMYGIVYLLFATFSVVFQTEYGWKEGISGLAYMGIGVGSVLGVLMFGRYSDRIYTILTEKHGEAKPEYRLIPLIPSAIAMPIGLLLYGWSAQYDVHYMVPIIGTGFTGFSIMGCMAAIQAYLVDAFPVSAASVLAANSLVRSIAGGLIPLGGFGMYEKLGLGWGNTLLALLATFFGLSPVLFYKYGQLIRGWSLDDDSKSHSTGDPRSPDV
ncbi:MFS general substrate transporter [Aspergillus ambiguus]|uniref:MFS transporter n=1 Tax=Aspergillus ambiguus TaxID=176160 RepID=UPI003CCD15B3